MAHRATLNQLARALPDIPRWVETRATLFSDDCEIFGYEEDQSLRFVIRDTEEPFAFVVGRPIEEAIREAIAGEQQRCEIVVMPEDLTHVLAALPGWRATLAKIHLLGDDARLPDVPAGTTRVLRPSELGSLEDVPPDLRTELEFAVRRSPLVVGLDDDRPVSFCYASAETESLWDVAIDTLSGYRRRGHAARCAAHMISYMRRRGKQPIWGAEETNEASLGLAVKLGFVPVDELFVLRSSTVIE